MGMLLGNVGADMPCGSFILSGSNVGKPSFTELCINADRTDSLPCMNRNYKPRCATDGGMCLRKAGTEAGNK